MAIPPPSPPSPPEGDGTPDAGNPGQATPPEVAPRPGRQSARKGAGAEKKPAARARRSPTKARTAKAAAAPKPAATPRKPAKPRAAARPRPRPAGRSVATAPTDQPVDITATDPASRSRGHWWKALAGGIGALAAGAALFTLRGSSRRKAHQADGADKGATPGKPAGGG